MSPLQWASGMRWTATAVASASARAALVFCISRTSFCSRAASRASWTASRLLIRRWSSQSPREVMAVGMPSRVSRPPTESSITIGSALPYSLASVQP